MGGAYHVSWGGVLIPFAFTLFLKYYNQRGAQTNWNSTGACRGGLDIWYLTNILISVDEDEGRESRRADSRTREEKDAADEIREARICPLTSMGTLYGCDGGRGANTREMEEAASRSTQIQVYTGDVDKKYHCFFCQTHQRRVSKAGQYCHIIFAVMVLSDIICKAGWLATPPLRLPPFAGGAGYPLDLDLGRGPGAAPP